MPRRYSGRHAISTDCDLEKAPRRRTDGARVLDTEFYAVKLYTTDGGVKLLRRKSGKVEKQHRIHIGKLPIGYRAEPEGRFLYILEGAISEYAGQEEAAGKKPVPPCITANNDTTQVAIEVDDRADASGLVKVSADHVRVQIKSGISSESAGEELLELMRSVLAVKMSQLSIVRGESTRHKRLLVKGLSPQAVFDCLEAEL